MLPSELFESARNFFGRVSFLAEPNQRLNRRQQNARRGRYSSPPAVAACTDAVPFFQSLAERDAEVSKLRASATALEVELQRKTMDLGALQRQVCLHSGDDTL